MKNLKEIKDYFKSQRDAEKTFSQSFNHFGWNEFISDIEKNIIGGNDVLLLELLKDKNKRFAFVEFTTKQIKVVKNSIAYDLTDKTRYSLNLLWYVLETLCTLPEKDSIVKVRTGTEKVINEAGEVTHKAIFTDKSQIGILGLLELWGKATKAKEAAAAKAAKAAAAKAAKAAKAAAAKTEVIAVTQ